jgi:hypothetical protein
MPVRSLIATKFVPAQGHYDGRFYACVGLACSLPLQGYPKALTWPNAADIIVLANADNVR